jgi:His/Glu/Gln/Arg/opine family amino acid ABC transporter permease subunit
VLPPLRRISHGAATTLAVAALAALCGLAVGFALLALLHARWPVVRWIVRIYVSFVRGTPLLVQILLIYYALPGLLRIDLPAYAAGVLALSLNSGAFVVEILRGALSSIPKGQHEAAQALGLSPFATFRHVIVPQLLRHALAPMINELTILVKASALLSVITVVELTRVAQDAMNATFRPVEAFVTAGSIYFLILLALASLARALEP